MRRGLKAVALAMTVCLAVSGCGSKGDSDETTNETNNSNSESTEAATSAPIQDSSDTYESHGDVDRTYEAAITFSEPSGIYADEFKLDLSSDTSGEIYYTTDGTDPATSSTSQVYDGSVDVASRKNAANVISAISPTLFSTNFCQLEGNEYVSIVDAPSDSAVDKCTVVEACVKGDDGKFSKTYSQTYFIGTEEEHIQGLKESCEAAGQDLSVISITMDPDDLFDSETGIYARGSMFDEPFASYLSSTFDVKDYEVRFLAANYLQKGRAWERSAHIDFFEMNAGSTTNVLSQDCGIRIQGNYSRSDLQKSFRITAREEYGENNFNYAFFGDSDTDSNGDVIEKFKSLVIRNGGNYPFTSKFNDAYWQSYAQSLSCESQASRPCVVYLNGEYWGLYILQEDFSDDYFEDHYGVNKDDVVIYKGNEGLYDIGYKLDAGEIPDGETDDYYYKELLEFFDTHDNLNSDSDYEAFSKLVDVDSCKDYFAFQVMINNYFDWPGNNWAMWRTINTDSSVEKADNRWRFMIFDTEISGAGGSDEAYCNTIINDYKQPDGLLDLDSSNIIVRCFAYGMTNEKFRTAFCDQLEKFTSGDFSSDAAVERLDKFEDIYRPLFDQFFERYPGTSTTTNAFDGFDRGTCSNVRDFVTERADYIDDIISYVSIYFMN